MVFSDAFYYQLAESGKTLNTDPRDLLVLFASETNLNPASTAGLPYHGFNTMNREFAIANGVPGDVWDKLPELSPEDNLKWSTVFFHNFLVSFKRNGFTSALDMYLANFSPAAWTKDVGFQSSIYYYDASNPTSKSTNDYLENATIDSPQLYNYAKSKGLPFRNSKDIKAAAQLLISEQGIPNTILKGAITVGDLQRFMLRPGLDSIWGPHVKRFDELGLVAYSLKGTTWKPAAFDYGYVEYNPGVDEDEFKRRRREASGGTLAADNLPKAPTRKSGESPILEDFTGYIIPGALIGLGLYALKKIFL
jgi:hypothetical protein